MRLYLALLLLPCQAFAYWAPHHQGMNLQVMREGQPWGGDFTRSGTPIETANDYIRAVLYVNAPEVMGEVDNPTPDAEDMTAKMCRRKGAESLVLGVPLREAAPGFVHASDKPTDAPTFALPLWCCANSRLRWAEKP